MVSGCAVVVRLRVTEAPPLPPLNETVFEVKLQPAPVGRALQLSVTLAGNDPVGDKLTAYTPGKPAATVAEGGLMDTVYPPAVNEAVAWLLVFVSLALETIAVTEQLLQMPFGVTTKVTVERAPDCSAGIWQTTPLLLGALQVPEFTVALLNVTPSEIGTLPLTSMFVAGSGPVLATVKVTVT